jgi:hypothetical protein
MLPKSVSPKFVFFATVLVGWLLILLLMPIELALIQRLGLRKDQHGGPYCIPISIIAALALVPKVLPSLGIRVRSRSVEWLRAAGREREDELTDELPIRIERGDPGFIVVMRMVLSIGGLACLVLAVCLMFLWFPPPHVGNDATVFVFALLGMAVILLGGASRAKYSQPGLLCEITEKGIRAPNGLWGRQTLVPWEDLARCEIIHDEERVWHDYFVLWDPAGRRHFLSSKVWLGRMRRSDRDRILRALRSRFPQEDKADPKAEPALVHQASSAVWDRDLDG